MHPPLKKVSKEAAATALTLERKPRQRRLWIWLVRPLNQAIPIPETPFEAFTGFDQPSQSDGDDDDDPPLIQKRPKLQLQLLSKIFSSRS